MEQKSKWKNVLLDFEHKKVNKANMALIGSTQNIATNTLHLKNNS